MSDWFADAVSFVFGLLLGFYLPLFSLMLIIGTKSDKIDEEAKERLLPFYGGLVVGIILHDLYQRHMLEKIKKEVS